MKLEGKRIAVLAADHYQELEVWYPLLRFREEGAETFVLAARAGQTYTSKRGYPVVADQSLDEVSAGALDAVIIPGGWAPEALRQDARVLHLVREMDRTSKVIGCICHGGWVIASAGIVRGRKVTCYQAIKDDLISAGADYVDAEVTVDGNLITSRMPTDLPAFCREISKALAATAVAAAASA